MYLVSYLTDAELLPWLPLLQSRGIYQQRSPAVVRRQHAACVSRPTGVYSVYSVQKVRSRLLTHLDG